MLAQGCRSGLLNPAAGNKHSENFWRRSGKGQAAFTAQLGAVPFHSCVYLRRWASEHPMALHVAFEPPLGSRRVPLDFILANSFAHCRVELL